MKFKFKLEMLLKQRNIQVNLDRKSFLDKQNELLNEEQVLADLISLKSRTQNQRSEHVLSDKNWQATVNQMNNFLLGQDLRIENQNKRLLQIKKEVEILRQILLKSVTDARMVEKLKEKKKSEFIKNVTDIEQKELDEIVSLRFENKNEVGNN